MNTPQNTGAADSAQHTPGPFLAEISGDGFVVVTITEGGNYSRPLAVIPAGNPRGFADADLFAAAPDLLAALAMLADWADQSAVALGDDHPLAAESDWVISAARDAIARAKGGAL
jgi:hypothetical protein